MSAPPAELVALLDGTAFAPTYGFRLTDAGDGECTVEVPYKASFDRPGGVISGPVFMAAADAATWMAILTRLGAADGAVTVEMNTAFLAAARREDFRCHARVIRWGRSLVYAVAECVAGDGRILTHHTVTYLRPASATAAAASAR